MLTVQHLDGTLLSINIVSNDGHTCKVIQICLNLCISNLPCILLFSYLLKKSLYLNVQAIIINLRGWFCSASLSKVQYVCMLLLTKC